MNSEPTRPRRRRTIRRSTDENRGANPIEPGYAPPPGEIRMPTANELNFDPGAFQYSRLERRAPFRFADRTISLAEVDWLPEIPGESVQDYEARQRRADREAYRQYRATMNRLNDVGRGAFGRALDMDPRLRERFETIEEREIFNRRADRLANQMVQPVVLPEEREGE